HLKSRQLTGGEPRRTRFIGKSILPGVGEHEQEGLAVAGDALLPFLLAARATSQAPDSRPVFAEGLASSYQAFLHTRSNRRPGSSTSEKSVDTDDEDSSEAEINEA